MRIRCCVCTSRCVDNWPVDNWPVTFLGGVGQLASDFLKVVLEFFFFFNFIDTKHTGLNSSKCFTSTTIGIQGKTRL